MQRGKRHYRITLQDVLEAHERALRFGGRSGILDLGRVEAAIGRPYMGRYPRIHDKAAALVESLSRNHGFVDGNKRTTLEAVWLLISRSGFRLESVSLPALNAEVEEMIVAAAEGRMRYADLRAWFLARLRPR